MIKKQLVPQQYKLWRGVTKTAFEAAKKL